jgi:hypothetical protein
MEEVNRRLAGILAVDVVGYSAKMGADDADTLARVYLRRRATAHVDSLGVAKLVSKLSKRGTEGSNPPHSAIESFSVYDSAKDDRNMRLRGQLRMACGTGERSEPRIPTICGPSYPQRSDSGPRRKCAGPPSHRVHRSGRRFRGHES